MFKDKTKHEVKNIWRYADFYPPVAEKFRLTLGEGWTPLEESPRIAKSLGLEKLFLKREDKNPGGSHKDRGLAYQLSRACEEGRQRLVVSSSGNAAISASAYAKLAGIKLFVFVSPNIEKRKLAKVIENGAFVAVCRRPVSFAEYAGEKFGIKNVKSSSDANSVYGYKSLGFEIFEQVGNVDSVFLAVSSGTALLGIGGAWQDFIKAEKAEKCPQLHLVQTSKINVLASRFDKDFVFEKESLAKAIVARHVPKEKEILEAVAESGGSGWVVSNGQIKKASEILAENGIDTSYEGAAALAAMYKAKDKGFDFGRNAVCVLTGRSYGASCGKDIGGVKVGRSEAAMIDNLAELDRFMERNLS